MVYAMNTETVVSPARLDGSRVVTQQGFLVPTDQVGCTASARDLPTMGPFGTCIHGTLMESSMQHGLDAVPRSCSSPAYTALPAI